MGVSENKMKLLLLFSMIGGEGEVGTNNKKLYSVAMSLMEGLRRGG